MARGRWPSEPVAAMLRMSCRTREVETARVGNVASRSRRDMTRDCRSKGESRSVTVDVEDSWQGTPMHVTNAEVRRTAGVRGGLWPWPWPQPECSY
eukprot:336558-Rhodomonas_salina.2